MSHACHFTTSKFSAFAELFNVLVMYASDVPRKTVTEGQDNDFHYDEVAEARGTKNITF